MRKNKKNLVWTMTADVALEFYQRCMEMGAETLRDKLDILVDLAKEGKIANVVETGRTLDEIARDSAKNFGNTLYIKGRKSQNEHEDQ